MLGLLLALAVFAVYSNSLGGEWIYDDHSDILGSQSIQKLWPLKEHFLQHYKGETGVHPRPLVGLTFTLNFMLGHNDPFIFHLTNVVIHILATLCLFDLLRLTLHRLSPSLQAPRNVDILALFTALLWGLHPLQTEAVAYITQRYESLMGLFVFLTLLCASRSAQSRHALGWSTAATLSCLLAMASKEVAVSLPILVLLYDRTFLAGSFRGAWRARRRLYLAFVAVWALFALNQAFVIKRPFAGLELPWAWWQYAANQPNVILHYLRLVVWPHPLVLDYLWQPTGSFAALLPGFLAVGTLLAATLVALVRNSWLGFLGSFFFLILAPTSSVMPILDLAVEHRMYLPLAPILVCLILGAHLLSGWAVRQRAGLASLVRAAALICGAVVVAVFGTLTYLRSDDYRNSLSLWLDTVNKRPSNGRARANYAHALHQAGRLEEAIIQTRLAVALAPNNATMRVNLGAFLAEKGESEQALQEFLQASRIDPTDPRPWVNLGLLYMRSKELDKAQECLQRALVLDDRNAQAHLLLGDVSSLRGDFAEGLEHYRLSLQLQPGYSIPHWGIGQALLDQGHLQASLMELDAYIAMDAQPVKAAHLVGQSLLRRGHVPEAVAYWREALRRDPTYVPTLLLMSWMRATHPLDTVRNGAEALALAETALHAREDRAPAALEALGTAYAELGRFPEACAATEEAIARLRMDPTVDLSSSEARLVLFRQGKPYREDPSKRAP